MRQYILNKVTQYYFFILILLSGCDQSGPDILVLDFGSPSTPRIGQRLEALHVTYKIAPGTISAAEITNINPKGIITSGSPDSVLDSNSRKPAAAIYQMGIPVLGICYGMQLMASQLGGKVARCEVPEQKVILPVTITDKCDLFPEGTPQLKAWFYHEDCVVSMPSDFQIVAHARGSRLAAVCNPKRKLYGVQFHPERFDKAPEAAIVFDRFVNKIVLGRP